MGFLLELLARGENRLFSPEEVRPICFCGSCLCSCPLSPFRFFLPPTAGERVILSFVDSFPHKSFACGERRIQSKNKSRLAAGDAPVQVASLSDFGNYKKHLRHFFILDSERFAARAPRITTSAKQERLKRSVFPKGVNVPLLPNETTPSGTEGKPDFPLKSDQILFLYASR